MANMIDLPNGDLLAVESIRGLRRGNSQEANYDLALSELKPRVMIDYVVGQYGHCTVIDCDSDEGRDALFAELRAHLR